MLIRILPLALVCFLALCATVPARAGDVVGKVVVGYQGWHDAEGSGSPVNGWWHFSRHGGPLKAGNIAVEMWPDTREYTKLYKTDFAPLGNGQPAQLYSDYDYSTVLTHFKWMSQYGIDCAALQRFHDQPELRNDVSLNVKKAAEATGEKFYIMYDVSGWNTFGDDLPKDWNDTLVGKLHLTDSSAYAREGGKPVVCIWGFGFGDRPDEPVAALQTVNWFKAHGCYVILGVPRDFRNDQKFADVYKASNMLSPWTVGSYKNVSGADDYRDHNLVPDLAFCKANGIDYQPVIFPGFAWSNWQKPPAPVNDFPRLHGDFMWEQFANVRRTGITNAYVAMFDEVNEGTAIYKVAEDDSMKPTDQYFLTLDADGVHCSSDFYLRLVADGTAMVKGFTPLQDTLPTPHVVGETLFHTGFETADPAPDWINSPDTEYNKSPLNVVGYEKGTKPSCYPKEDMAHTGKRSLAFSGEANGGRKTYCTFKVFSFSEHPLELSSTSTLSYALYPSTDNARYTAIDLHFTDGSTLHDKNCLDQSGNSINAAAGHGANIALNTWSQFTSPIGEQFAGKKVDKIWVTFNRPEATGIYRGYIDDILITR